MRPNVFLCFLCLAGAAITSSGVVHGAPPPAKGDVATDKARELYLEGDELYKQGQFARARVSFLAAWGLKKHWQLAGNLGDCEVKLGMYRDAAEHLAYFLRSSPTQPPPAGAAKLYAEARAKTSALTITVDTVGADVLVDGQMVGKAPLLDPVFVEPGHHSVEARLGAKWATGETEVALGGERGVGLTLIALVAPAPANESVTAPPDKPIIKEPGRSLVPAFVIGGVGAASLAIGIGLLVDAGAKGSSARELHDALLKTGHSCVTGAPNYDARCAELSRTASTGDTRHSVGVGFLVGSGAAAVGATAYFLWSRSNTSAARSHRFRLAPAVSATNAGLVFSGTF